MAESSGGIGWEGLALGAASLIGGAGNNISSARQAEQQRFWAGNQAQINRDYGERMANSAHQREINDLRAAGLNPMLSGMGGSGAATPSGSQPSGAMANTQDIVSPAVSTALEARRLKKEITAVDSQTALNTQTAEKAKREAILAGTANKLKKTENDLAMLSIPKVVSDVNAAIKENQVREKNADFDNSTNKFQNWNNKIISPTISSAASLANPFAILKSMKGLQKGTKLYKGTNLKKYNAHDAIRPKGGPYEFSTRH